LDEQADLLRSRGMAGERGDFLRRLAVVNYYRLSVYWYPFREADGRFKAGTTLDAVWGRYTFDRELRHLVMDAIERVEVAVRASLAYAHALEGGPFGYATDPSAIFRADGQRRTEFLQRVEDEVRKSNEPFVQHFRDRYGDSHRLPPIWMATEVLTFGSLSRLCQGSSRQVRLHVARGLNVPESVLESWLRVMTELRNICAHHGLLWHRDFHYAPRLLRVPAWQELERVRNKPFAVLSVLAHCLHAVAPGSGWGARLTTLFDKHPEVPKGAMGFPEDWRARPMWAALLKGGSV
jgi:abortive infection bacteriophage resistance protein